MRLATLLVALITIVVGIVGIVSPASGMTLRRLYFATPGRFYAAGAIRVAMFTLCLRRMQSNVFVFLRHSPSRAIQVQLRETWMSQPSSVRVLRFGGATLRQAGGGSAPV